MTMASMAFSPTETRIKPYLPPTLWMPELTALAMSRLLPFLPILLLILLSPSCNSSLSPYFLEPISILFSCSTKFLFSGRWSWRLWGRGASTPIPISQGNVFVCACVRNSQNSACVLVCLYGLFGWFLNNFFYSERNYIIIGLRIWSVHRMHGGHDSRTQSKPQYVGSITRVITLIKFP